jgi:hypothetical protein
MHKIKSHKTVEQIAKKHRLDVSFIQKQLDMGEPIEHEHTKDHELAMDIALQHLDEIPDYYTRLKKMEASAKKEHKKFKDIKENEYDVNNIDDTDTPIHMHYKHGIHIDYEKRYCPKCKRVEMRKECKYGPRYWDIFSMPEKLKEGNLHQWFKGSKSKEGKPGWVNVVTGGTCASDEPGEGTPKCVSSAKRASMTKAERLSASRRKKAADPGQQQKTGAAKPTYVSTDSPRKKMKESKDHEYSMARSELSTIMSAAKRLKAKMGKGEGEIEAWVQSKITKAADYLDTAADYVDSGEMNEEADKKSKSSGKKDACYNKVKSRYSVWPSAYASGALVKCRKVGAANWGNKSEGLSPLVQKMIEEFDLDEACWSGYKQVGMKKKGKKIVPNCVPTNEETKCPKCSGKTCKCETPEPDEYNPRQMKEVGESVRLPATNGNIISVIISWRGKTYMNKMFFPQIKMPNRREVTDQIQKVYPGATVLSYNVSGLEPGQPMIQVYDPQKSKNYLLNNKTIGEETIEEVAAWQRKEGKNKAGGLNEKGRKSYERENPGSDLKAPSKKVGNPRRASFCARMKGMKKKLTSAKTANDPDSRINKSLRAWNC